MTNIVIDKKIVSWKTGSNSSENNSPSSSFKENHAIKRPKELTCEIHKVKVKGESWTILVGLFEGKPYEVFGGLSKYIEIPKKYNNGILQKNGKVNGISTYNLIIGENDEEFTIKDVVKIFENTTQGAFTRLISLSLRHGTPVNFIVEQLSKDEHSDITSFSKVIARVLKSYIKDGTKSKVACASCGQYNVIFAGGCNNCLDCGYSKCG
jgi:ribonucleoside-diphosphate reductase alpha chain